MQPRHNPSRSVSLTLGCTHEPLALQYWLCPWTRLDRVAAIGAPHDAVPWIILRLLISAMAVLALAGAVVAWLAPLLGSRCRECWELS